jgi:hypothetical protein
MTSVSGYAPVPGLAGLTCSRPSLSGLASVTAAVTLTAVGPTQLLSESLHSSAGTIPYAAV